ncbi:hypothetical protein AB0C29_11020 [Actinoplanes sp. NPDC048791]|uniref:hypothetical protein n=1 Tax=Actinoplanes sp. NPDC048791 TaxID=3154623 RepID=UPI003409E68E
MGRPEPDAYAAVAPVLRQLAGTLESIGAEPLPLARYRRPPGRVACLLHRAIGQPPPGDRPRYRVTGHRAWPLTDGGDHRPDLALDTSGEILLAHLRRSGGVGVEGPADHLHGHQAGTQFLEYPYSLMSRAYCSVLPDGSVRVIVELASWGGPDRGEYLLSDVVAATVCAYTSNPVWYR